MVDPNSCHSLVYYVACLIQQWLIGEAWQSQWYKMSLETRHFRCGSNEDVEIGHMYFMMGWCFSGG